MMIKSLVFILPLIVGFTMGQKDISSTTPSTTTLAPLQCPSQMAGPTNGFNTQSLTGTYTLAAILFDSNFTSPAQSPPPSLVNATAYFNWCNITELFTYQNNVVTISYNGSVLANIAMNSNGKGTGLVNYVESNTTAVATWLIDADGWMVIAYCFTGTFWWQQYAFDIIVIHGPPTPITQADVNAKITQIQATGIVLDGVWNFCGGNGPSSSGPPPPIDRAAERFYKNE